MGLQMKAMFFLAVTALYSTVSIANDDSKPCNVIRTGKPPLFAKDCSDLGDGNFLITPCSSNLSVCKTSKENIAGGEDCDSKSPSTPTPKETIAALIQQVAPKFNASIIDLSIGDKAAPQQVMNDRFYFAKVGGESYETKVFASSLKIASAKGSISPRFLSGEKVAKSTLGWQLFKIQGNELKPIPLSTVVPECETSLISDHLVPTSKKDE